MPHIITAPLSRNRSLTIEVADDASSQERAGGLVARRYAWRGYGRVGLQAAQHGWRTTLTARADDSTVGTLTVTLDAEGGLAADTCFADEVAALRRQGRRLAEFTRLAVEPCDNSERVLAALFHVGHALAHGLHGRDLLLIEVHPRHVRYHARLIGAQVIATASRHATVDAPAVLMAIDLARVEEKIARSAEPRHRGRSPFAWAFGAQQLGRILRALKSRDGLLARARPLLGMPPTAARPLPA